MSILNLGNENVLRMIIHQWPITSQEVDFTFNPDSWVFLLLLTLDTAWHRDTSCQCKNRNPQMKKWSWAPDQPVSQTCPLCSWIYRVFSGFCRVFYEHPGLGSLGMEVGQLEVAFDSGSVVFHDTAVFSFLQMVLSVSIQPWIKAC